MHVFHVSRGKYTTGSKPIACRSALQIKYCSREGEARQLWEREICDVCTCGREGGKGGDEGGVGGSGGVGMG